MKAIMRAIHQAIHRVDDRKLYMEIDAENRSSIAHGETFRQLPGEREFAINLATIETSS